MGEVFFALARFILIGVSGSCIAISTAWAI